MGMPTTSIAQNPTSSAPVQQSGGKGGGKGMGSMMPPQQTQQMPQQPDQGYRSTLQAQPSMLQGGNGKGASSIQPSNMTISSTSGQPTTGQPNPYPNTTGSWDNSATQQSSPPMGGGKGKG